MDILCSWDRIFFIGAQINNSLWNVIETEYKAFDNVVVEVMWIQPLLTKIGLNFPFSPCLWIDNKGVTYLASNPSFLI